MKRILAFTLALVMVLTMAACSGSKKGPTYDGTMSELMDAIYEKFTPETMLMPNTKIETTDADMLSYYAAVPDGTAVSEVYYSEAAINIDPYILSVSRVAEGKDAKAVAQDILNTADVGRWVCVRPEACRVGQIGDVVVMVMGSTEVTGNIMDAFAQVMGTDLETSLQK